MGELTNAHRYQTPGLDTLRFNEPWIYERADPYVYRHVDGTYYFTASVPKFDGICLRQAESLAALPHAEETEIWHKHESVPMSTHIWAPELHYLDGTWYIYYAGDDKDNIWSLRPYVLCCRDEDPITGTWTELGPLLPCESDEFSFRAFSLDATVFENNGRRFCIWAEKVGPGRQISNLYIAQMETPVRMKTPQVLLTTPDYDWERHGFWVNEGPAVIRHGGRIFLTYSASDTGVHYCMGLLRADETADLLDPLAWHKSRYPVLETDADLKIFGPGHNFFTLDEDGADIMVFHARTKSHVKGNPLYDPGRHAFLMRVKWDASGQPVFSFHQSNA